MLKEEKRGAQKIFEEIMIIFSKSEENINTQIPE